VKPQKNVLSGLLGGELGGLASGLAPGLDGGAADVARIEAVLESITVADAVIEKFGLRDRYGEKYQETTRKALWRHCEAKSLKKPSLVQMTCEDRDPAFAQKMLAFFADYGNQVFRRVGASSASEEVRFLESHVAELRATADASAAQMRDFEEKHQVVDLETQSKAVVSALAALNSQRISKQLELEYARTFSASDEASLRQLRSQISVMDEKLRDLELPERSTVPSSDGSTMRRRRSGATRGMFPAALDVPGLKAEYEKLYRDRKVAEATLVFALERLEAARANEAREVSTFVVLDAPTLATRHSQPRRSLVVLESLVFGLFVALALEWVRSAGGLSAVLSLALPREAPASGQPTPARSRGAANDGAAIDDENRRSAP